MPCPYVLSILSSHKGHPPVALWILNFKPFHYVYTHEKTKHCISRAELIP